MQHHMLPDEPKVLNRGWCCLALITVPIISNIFKPSNYSYSEVNAAFFTFVITVVQSRYMLFAFPDKIINFGYKRLGLWFGLAILALFTIIAGGCRYRYIVLWGSFHLL